MSHNRTHYDTLGVARTSPPEVVRAAYRVLSQQYHPDKNPGNKHAAELMKAINVAYDTLSDPERRRRYDESLNSAKHTATEETEHEINPRLYEVFCTKETCRQPVVHERAWPTVVTSQPRRMQYSGRQEYKPDLFGYRYRCACGNERVFTFESGAFRDSTDLVKLYEGMVVMDTVLTGLFGDPKDPKVRERMERQTKYFKIFLACTVIAAFVVAWLVSGH